MENPLAKPASTAAAATRDLFRLSWWWLPRPTRQDLAKLLGGDAAEAIKRTEEGSAGPPPAALIDEVTLRDGTKAWLRPILPSDREMHREGYERLSADSKFQRFVSPIPQLSESLLDQLVDSVDGVDHVAYYLFVEDWHDLPVGIGRIVRYPDEPDLADIAVTVQDDWQGRGIATALVAFLVAHRPVGVTRLETVVADDNPASLALLRRIGPAEITHSQGVHEVRIQLGEEQLAQIAATNAETAKTADEAADQATGADGSSTASTPSRPRKKRRRRHRLPHEVLHLDKLFLDWRPLLITNDTQSARETSRQKDQGG